MTRRLFLAALTCLPVAWRVRLGAHSDAYLPFDRIAYEDLRVVFNDLVPNIEGIIYARIGYERLDGTIDQQEFVGLATVSVAILEGGRLPSLPPSSIPRNRDKLLQLAYEQARRNWPQWHRAGWLRVVTANSGDGGRWIPIRRIWAIR